jgi:hypothetical protein
MTSYFINHEAAALSAKTPEAKAAEPNVHVAKIAKAN